MGEDKDLVTDSPEKNAGEAEISRLGRIEELLGKTAGYRKTKGIVTGLGLALILLTVVVFVVRIVELARNYDTKALAGELEKQAALLAESREAKDLVAEIRNTCLPELQKEVVARFKAEEPTLKFELNKAADNLKDYVAGPVKDKFISSVFEAVSKIERDILTRKNKFTPERVEKIVAEGQKIFIEDFTTKLETRLNDMDDDLVALNAAIQKFTETPEYAKLDPKLCGEYENRVVESMLELFIYHLNPQRGALPASVAKAKGGAQ